MTTAIALPYGSYQPAIAPKAADTLSSATAAAKSHLARAADTKIGRGLTRLYKSEAVRGVVTGAGIMAAARFGADMVATSDAGITAAFCGAAAGGHAYYKSYNERCEEAVKNGETPPVFIFDREAIKRDGIRAAFRKNTYDVVGMKAAGISALKTFATTGLGGFIFQGAAEYFENMPPAHQELFGSFMAGVKEFFAPVLNLFGFSNAAEAATQVNLSQDDIIYGGDGDDTLLGHGEAHNEAAHLQESLDAGYLNALLDNIENPDDLSDKAKEAYEFLQRDNPPAWAYYNMGYFAVNGQVPGLGQEEGIAFLKQGINLGYTGNTQGIETLAPDYTKGDPVYNPDMAKEDTPEQPAASDTEVENEVTAGSPLEELAQMEGLNEQAEAIRAAALEGKLWAQNDAAIGLLHGVFGFPQNSEVALAMLEKAANDFHPKSVEDLLHVYTHGAPGIAPDPEKAAAAAEKFKAILSGSPEAATVTATSTVSTGTVKGDLNAVAVDERPEPVPLGQAATCEITKEAMRCMGIEGTIKPDQHILVTTENGETHKYRPAEEMRMADLQDQILMDFEERAADLQVAQILRDLPANDDTPTETASERQVAAAEPKPEAEEKRFAANDLLDYTIEGAA